MHILHSLPITPAVDSFDHCMFDLCYHRVRRSGVSFKCTSLHNGSVQLWNYQMSTFDRFEEHRGIGVLSSHVCRNSSLRSTPVRGVTFHPTRLLLATGGDGYKQSLGCVCGATWLYRLATSKQATPIHIAWLRVRLSSSIMKCRGLYAVFSVITLFTRVLM